MATEIKVWCDKDPVLSKVQKFVMTVWLVDNNDNKKALQSYFNKKKMNLASTDVSFGGHMLLFHLRDVKW